MSIGESIVRIIIVMAIFGFMLVAIDFDKAAYAALFGMLFGTALERLILANPHRPD